MPTLPTGAVAYLTAYRKNGRFVVSITRNGMTRRHTVSRTRFSRLYWLCHEKGFPAYCALPKFRNQKLRTSGSYTHTGFQVYFWPVTQPQPIAA